MRSALDEATGLADSCGAGAATELRRQIARTEAALRPRVVAGQD
jgi:hypothetical protein